MLEGKLITIDDTVTILADPGWSGIETDLDCYTPLVSKIDIILLSQSTVDFIGALPYLYYRFPLLENVPIFSTLPTMKMGKTAVLEFYSTLKLLGPVNNTFKLELSFINSIFNRIKSLNYSQTIRISIKSVNLSITSLNSGYSLGGSIWVVENNKKEKIIYAPMWNHSKDNYLNGCNIFSNQLILRPTTFITNSEPIESNVAKLKSNHHNNNNILIPITLTARFFEVILPILTKSNVNAPIYLVNYTKLENLKILGNFIEWMNSNIIKFWETQSSKLLENNRIKCINLREVEDLMDSRPAIFFVDYLDHRDSNFWQLVSRFENFKKNFTILMTEKPNPNSNMNNLYKSWKHNIDSTELNPKEGELTDISMEVDISSFVEVPLHGSDLSKYEKLVAESKEKEIQRLKEVEELAKQQKQEEQDENEDDEEDDEDDDDDIVNGTGNGTVNGDRDGRLGRKDLVQDEAAEQANLENQTKYQFNESTILRMDQILSIPRDFDFRLFKERQRVFPNVNLKLSIDDYGVVIKHADFQTYENDRFPIIADRTNNENAGLGNGRLRDGNGDDDAGSEGGDYEGNRNVGNNRKKRKITESYSLDPLKDPVQRIYTTRKLKITCGFTFIDMSGQHDLRSLKISIEKLKPRKLIILPEFKNGNVNNLIEELNKDIMVNKNLNTEVLKSKLNKSLNLGDLITNYEILIDDDLAKSLNWNLLNDEYNVSSINGIVEKIKDWDYKLVKDGGDGSNKEKSKIKIGDIKLTKLRNILSKNHSVELLGDGRLIIDDEIIVSKEDDGDLKISSNLSPLFYTIKQTIENLLATI
ncbi:hypothetical protein CAS74_000138 [Pichia kudriavzevii]|uniref:Cleavage and polyadenylation specificity factor subunit 2 n=1 Tax=Pichia kudriavzevii TaxID=4909 RepID=A0A1Z8JT43_PICKU|nr:hypothetical protein CAS74_000138 [Pichia kudriavzevii]